MSRAHQDSVSCTSMYGSYASTLASILSYVPSILTCRWRTAEEASGMHELLAAGDSSSLPQAMPFNVILEQG